MATVPCIVFALLLAAKPSYSAVSVMVSGPRLNTTFEYSSVFGTPFVNVPFTGIVGAAYFFTNASSTCGPFPPPTYPLLPDANSSFIIVQNYSECILEKVSFAKVAGYDALLTYEENDTNSTITDALLATGFPVVILPENVAANIIENGTVLSPNDPTLVTLQADIVVGIVIVLFSFVILICSCCLCLFWTVLCCNVTNGFAIRQQARRLEEEERNYAGRRELIESILRHLAELENSLGHQVPLGRNQAEDLPTRLFRKGEERDETCSVCVDDFEDGVLVKVLPCHHIFHPVCIDQWLAEYSSICPMCKADVRHAARSGGNTDNSNPVTVVSDDEEEASSDNGSGQALMSSFAVSSRGYGSVPEPNSQ